MGTSKKDKEAIRKLIEANKALQDKITKLGLTIEEFINASDETQKDVLKQNYDDFRDKYYWHEPCAPGQKFNWDTHQCEGPAVECGAGQHWDEQAGKCVDNTVPIPEPHPEAGKDVNGITKIYKDATSNLFVNSSSFTEEEFTRNYQSGKPSENSYENEYKSDQKLDNIEVTYYVKINGFKTKEPDTISIKTKGPDHQDGDGKAWYIHQIDTDGKPDDNFQIESPHPENHDNHVIPFFTIGESLVGKWIGIKAISYLIDNGTDASAETWIDYPVADIANPPNKWRKYIDIASVKACEEGFINATGGNVLLRIDGTKKGDMPNVKYQSLREIIPEGNVPTIPPVVTPPPTPTEPPTPTPSGKAAYDSNGNGGWKNGQARTVTGADGNIQPDGKGLEMHASGDPTLIIDGQGTAVLQCKPGHGRAYIFCKNYNGILEEEIMFDANVENHTIQTRSRHQEGGDGPNRFGGLSAKVSPVDVGLKMERFHNEHLADQEKKLDTPLELGKWYPVKYTFNDTVDGKGIYQKLEVNGQVVIEQTTTEGIEPYFVDKAKFAENSYFWLRMNNTKAAKLGIRNVKLTLT